MLADFLAIEIFLSGVVLIFRCLETEDDVPIVSLLLLTDGDVDLAVRLSREVFDLFPELKRAPEIFCLLPDCESYVLSRFTVLLFSRRRLFLSDCTREYLASPAIRCSGWE